MVAQSQLQEQRARATGPGATPWTGAWGGQPQTRVEGAVPALWPPLIHLGKRGGLGRSSRGQAGCPAVTRCQGLSTAARGPRTREPE